MGNIFSSTKVVEPKQIKDFERIVENMKKRNLNASADFSLKKLKKRAVNLFEESKKINELNLKINKLEEAISYDNTNESILKDYLMLLKLKNNDIFNKNIEKYYYHISPNTYKELLQKDKSFSSKELLILTFEKFRNYDCYWELDLNKILLDCLSKHELTKFFYNNKKINERLFIANSNFTIKSNLELALYEIFFSLYKEINSKIYHIYKIINDKDKNLKDKITILCPDIDFTNKLIHEGSSNISIVLLHQSYLFVRVFPHIKNYISALGKILNKCLNFNDIENDYYFLVFIILEIKYMIRFGDLSKSTFQYVEKLKQIKNNNIINENNQDFEIKEGKAIISKNINNKSIILDYNKYYMNEVIDFLKNINPFSQPGIYAYNKYVKLEYFNSDNYVTMSKDFINAFNKYISNSKTIITVLYELYPELKEFNLFESDFIENLFIDALNTCYFFPFYGKKGAITLNESGTILFFIPNRAKLDDEILEITTKKDCYIITNLGIFVYLEFHEILGHLLRVILSKLIDYHYISPRSIISNTDEVGECIELLLFGKRIEKFTIKQALYILDINNYNKNYNDFRKDFQNLNSAEYLPSKDMENMLSNINVNIHIIDTKSNEYIGYLFSEKYINMDDIADFPVLHNCCEKYEFNIDEDFAKLLDEDYKKAVNALNKK